MTLIEQAARRIEELRRAGVTIPRNEAGLGVPALKQRNESVAPAHMRDGTASSRLTEAYAVRRTHVAADGRDNVAVAEASPFHDATTTEKVTLDLAALERNGCLVPADARSSLGEEFRHIKRPLLRNAANGKPNDRMSLVMITSALPGEGKTFTAINLAMSMAIEIDTSVLLVDADVLRPGVFKRLGLAPRKGLLDVLTDDAISLSDVVMATNVKKLSILSAGTYDNRSTELLASDAMDRLLEELAMRYPNHMIVFDGPPLLLTNEAKVLASRVGQVVMVVEASRTPRSAVEKALSAFDESRCVMTVLNKREEVIPAYGYGSYYR